LTDHYAILGIAPDANDREIKAAWKAAAKASHPDRHPNDPTAESRFKRAQTAWQVLSDPVQRRQHDLERQKNPAPTVRKEPRRPSTGEMPWWLKKQADAGSTKCVGCGGACNPGAVRCDPCWELYHQAFVEDDPTEEWLNVCRLIRDPLRHARRVCYRAEQDRLEQIFGHYGYWSRHGVPK
jgi:curved DNA-binding protein CbpA